MCTINQILWCKIRDLIAQCLSVSVQSSLVSSVYFSNLIRNLYVNLIANLMNNVPEPELRSHASFNQFANESCFTYSVCFLW